jgi:L-ascorbate metabolism protein UlaG (beta-lactamase superfamily)
VRIDYLGHACFMVTGDSGKRAVFDPYEPGCFGGALRHAAPGVSAELVFVSHGHADHAAAGQVGGRPRVVDRPGAGKSGAAAWLGVRTFHDGSGGAERGGNVAYALKLDGVSFCHLGDLGHALSRAQAGEIGPVDVLFAPVGGHFTVDGRGAVEAARALSPRVLVPMHFKTPQVDFPIATLEDFLKTSPWPAERKGSAAEFAAGALPTPTVVWVMEASR